jgi:excisionase family DNA binding protein
MTISLVGIEDTIREIFREVLVKQPTSTGWLNVESAAKHLDTTKDAIYAMVRRGDLVPHRTPTGRLLFRTDELDAWVLGGGS